ncbi:MAG: hypothetical protein JRH20_25915 [Deltaproteobacteria bacterium]|nr:hypothetical protein [Deltaproteobacteria bacterium]
MMALRALEIGDYLFDDALMATARREQRAQHRVYCLQEPLVVLGRGSKVEAELDVEACLKDGVAVVRRRGGGCAVVLDPGQVVVSVALPAQGIGDNKRYLDGLSRWLIAGLEGLGSKGIEQAGISDLAQAGRKISGSCVHRSRDLLYYSATLLMDPRVELMARYLAHPPREPDYRGARSHEAFVGRLHLPSFKTAEALQEALATKLASSSLTPHIPGLR